MRHVIANRLRESAHAPLRQDAHHVALGKNAEHAMLLIDDDNRPYPMLVQEGDGLVDLRF